MTDFSFGGTDRKVSFWAVNSSPAELCVSLFFVLSLLPTVLVTSLVTDKIPDRSSFRGLTVSGVWVSACERHGGWASPAHSMQRWWYLPSECIRKQRSRLERGQRASSEPTTSVLCPPARAPCPKCSIIFQDNSTSQRPGVQTHKHVGDHFKLKPQHLLKLNFPISKLGITKV